jgi:hypothetical protein
MNTDNIEELNFGAVMERNHRAIRAANARTNARILLTDENSLRHQGFKCLMVRRQLGDH